MKIMIVWKHQALNVKSITFQASSFLVGVCVRGLNLNTDI